MNTDNVVSAFPGSEGLPENNLLLDPEKKDAPYYCSHEVIRVDRHERLIHCAKCAATLDPFDFLRDNAMHLQTAWQNYSRVCEKIRVLSERCHELSKEEKRLKARVKTLQEKSSDFITTRGKP